MKAKKARRTKLRLRIPNDIIRRLRLVADQADVAMDDVVNVILTLHVVIAREEAKRE